jgi:hypothetical protein
VLDSGQKGSIAANDIKQLRDVQGVSSKLKDFYRTRINKEMVKVAMVLVRIPFSSWEKSRIIPFKFIKSRMHLSLSSKTWRSP